MSTWIIKDWMGNVIATGYKSFADGIDAAQTLAENWASNEGYDRDEADFERVTEEYLEDLYVVNVDDNGKEIADEGQYTL